MRTLRNGVLPRLQVSRVASGHGAQHWGCVTRSTRRLSATSTSNRWEAEKPP